MLGKDVSLISDKTATSECREENYDCITSHTEAISRHKQHKEYEESALAVEMCLTSILFKDLDIELEDESKSNPYEVDEAHHSDVESTEAVIEEEALRYIGGYIVKKFVGTYAYLGKKASNCEIVSNSKSWIEMIDRGQLYLPSDVFFSQLVKMRAMFKAVHGESLREGKYCFSSLASAIERMGIDLPTDVMLFFCKISVYFRMKHLNKVIDMEKKGKSCRNTNRKMMKMTK